MPELNLSDLNRIIEIVRISTGFDFSDYATASLQRRVERFFEVKRISGFADFQGRMITDPDFPESFINEVTVNVTEMFRDPGFWIELKEKVIPVLFSKPSVTIWHAACSSGEEVYSMAILLRESGMLRKTRILATDLNKQALQQAIEGVYPAKSMTVNEKNYHAFNPAGQLSNYYKTADYKVHFDKSLTENVEFRSHDLVRNDSPGNYDLIICRNVFIYFNFKLQEKILDMFNKSMVPGAYLGIGSKESIAWTRSEKNFDTINFEEKIFRKRGHN